jgi:hypothetical protein
MIDDKCLRSRILVHSRANEDPRVTATHKAPATKSRRARRKTGHSIYRFAASFSKSGKEDASTTVRSGG